MSGLFGQIIQGVMGGGQQGGGSAISGILQQVMSVTDGDKQGIPAIISKFESAGLGQKVQSWIGTGQNAPVSSDQVGQAFSQDQLQDWANQAGTTTDKMKDVLAQALPHVVDHMTPEGQVPAQTQTSDISGLIGRLVGGSGGAKST